MCSHQPIIHNVGYTYCNSTGLRNKRLVPDMPYLDAIAFAARSVGDQAMWSFVLCLAVILTKWLPSQVICSRLNTPAGLAQAALAANMVASLWLTIILLTAHTLDWLSAPADEDWLLVSKDAIHGLVLVVGAPIALIMTPSLIAIIVLPIVCGLIYPIEWLVRGCAFAEHQRGAATVALLALLSGATVSLGAIVLANLNAIYDGEYLSMQCALAPFGLLAWLFARPIYELNR